MTDDAGRQSYQTGGNGLEQRRADRQISLNFSKIEFEYKEQKPDGTLGGAVKAGYDVKSQQEDLGTRPVTGGPAPREGPGTPQEAGETVTDTFRVVLSGKSVQKE